jgi:hypothetical protein
MREATRPGIVPTIALTAFFSLHAERPQLLKTALSGPINKLLPIPFLRRPRDRLRTQRFQFAELGDL